MYWWEQPESVPLKNSETTSLCLWGLHLRELRTLRVLVYSFVNSNRSRIIAIPLQLPRICSFANCCHGHFALRWPGLGCIYWGLRFGLWISHETWKPLYFPTVCCFLLSPEHVTYLCTQTKQANLPPHQLEGKFPVGRGCIFHLVIFFHAWHIVGAQLVEWLDRWMTKILFQFSSFENLSFIT